MAKCRLADALSQKLQVTSAPLAPSDTAFFLHDAAPPPLSTKASDRVSLQQLSEWLRIAVAAVAGPAPSPPQSLIVALALPSCSADESACLLLVASQPHWLFVPLDTRLPVARLQQILSDVNADRLITWDGSNCAPTAHNAINSIESCIVLPSLPCSSLVLHCYRLRQDIQQPPPWLSLAIAAAIEPLYVMFTSGSTGSPKGVVGTRRGAYERVQWWMQQHQSTRNPLDSTSTVVRATRLTFVDAVAEILSAFLSGAPLVHLQFAQDTQVSSVVLHQPSVFLTALAYRNVTRLTIVPSVLRVLLTAAKTETKSSLLSLQYLLVSGEPLPLSLVERVFGLLPHVTLLNMYGSTEVSGDVTCKTLTASLLKNHVTCKTLTASLLKNQELQKRWRKYGVPIGDWPVQAIGESTTLKLLHHASGEDEPAELCVSGGAVAAGYLTNGQLHQPPDKYTQDNHDHTQWFCMGDLCRVVAGELFVCGRRDRQVKIRGNRVQLDDVERAVRQTVALVEPASSHNHGAGDLQVVATRTSVREQDGTAGGGGEIVVFLIVDGTSEKMIFCEHCALAEVDAATRKALFQRLESQFGALYVPKAVVCVANDRVPRLASGKIDATRLTVQYQQHIESHCQKTRNKRRASERSENDGEIKIVLDLIQHTLGVSKDEELTDEATWLELGGNSLMATLLSWELEQKFQLRVPPTEILSMTIRELVEQATSRKHKKRERNDKQDAVVVITNMSPTPQIISEPPVQLQPSIAIRAWYSRYNQSSERPAPHVLVTTIRSIHTRTVDTHLRLSLIARVDLGKCIDASPLIVRTSTNSLLALVGSHSHQFVCLKIDSDSPQVSTGYSSRVLWTQTLDDRIEASATLSLRHALVFVGTYSGSLYAMAVATGDVRWRFHAQDMIKSSALVVESLDLVFVGSYDQRLYGLDAATGVVHWHVDLPGSVFSTPVFNQTSTPRMLIAATTTGVVIAWSLQTTTAPTGTILVENWRVQLPAPVFASLVVVETGVGEGDQEEEEVTRVVLVGCADGVLYALNAETGAKHWTFATHKPIFSSPCVVRTLTTTKSSIDVVIGSHDGNLRKISIENGALQWEISPARGDPIFASPCVAEIRASGSSSSSSSATDSAGISTTTAVVCAATTSGDLFFVDEASGHRIPSRISTATGNRDEQPVELGGEIFSSPVIVDDLCFVGTRRNELLVAQLSLIKN